MRLTILGFLLVECMACGPGSGTGRVPADAATANTDAGASVPFNKDSPFNVAIPENPILDANSDAMVAYLARNSGANAGLYQFGIPIGEAGAQTPRVAVTCTMDPAWGSCPFAAGVPIPDGAQANTGSDGVLVIVDPSERKSYEFWQFSRTTTGVTTSWGAVVSLDGSGWDGVGSSTAAGASRLGGVVRLAELEAGRIPHALVMSIDNSCRAAFRVPAVKTDGDSARADCTPQGARLELDPDIDLAQIPGLTEGERIIGRALQEYGVYVIDKGGAPMAISFELAPDATSASLPGQLYVSKGLTWDYYDIPKIPWARLRVLRQYNGG